MVLNLSTETLDMDCSLVTDNLRVSHSWPLSPHTSHQSWSGQTLVSISFKPSEYLLSLTEDRTYL